MDHPLPGLKYVAAKDLDGSGISLAGLDVNGVDGEKLGEVEGFVMDVAQGRPRHVAVGAGWFMHKHFLLPIGHVSRSADGTTLVADIGKDRVERFPGFDKSEFERLGPEQLTQLDARWRRRALPRAAIRLRSTIIIACHAGGPHRRRQIRRCAVDHRAVTRSRGHRPPFIPTP